MWDEAELREIEPEQKPKPLRRRDPNAGALRAELLARNRELASGVPHQLTRGGGAIYQPSSAHSHGNFLESSYRRICAHPAWFRRLGKAHTAGAQGRALDVRSDSPRGTPWRELDAASSSDALLMNLFCYPRVLVGARLPALLGVERGLEPLFGFKPRVPMHRGLVDTTEVDMKLGSLLVEAKLTEPAFPPASLRKAERYRDFHEVFDRELLVVGEQVLGYQAVRAVLTAHATGYAFSLLYDARRPEMLASWEQVVRAVRSFDLRARLKVLTWQELAAVMPGTVRSWLVSKYGIVPG